ncbi:MAG TPA: CPBP family intramembrane glutamic endopeptidase [Polyangiaceae bacterium]|nr:CPBP family intramembrane glutamic endopeptidase [Polyangiaceae bacterium]
MLQRACHSALRADWSLGRGITPVLLAPAWHTRALVGLMLAVAITGSLLEPAALQTRAGHSLLVRAYLPLVLVNVMLCIYASGVGLQRNILAELLGRRWAERRRLPTDLATAVGLALAVIAAENGLQRWLGLPESVAAHSLMPSSVGEKLAWAPVAAFVGFTEELVYRGYLQRQLAALSGWLPFGVLAQAALFGIAHAEQGPEAVARFACYACALGGVAAWRRSLLPGALAHVIIDWVAAASG